MIVSRNWLSDFVKIQATDEELTQRLTMSGLNHESSEVVDDDLAIDLEVTSNRPDCLGHIGIAREIAALFGYDFAIPTPLIKETGSPIANQFQLRIEAPELCRRFTARLIRNVQVGPSPQWLIARLKTIGVPTINNIVDISNYVMFECGQPLHVFDFDKIHGGQIIVRDPKPEEELVAIDHRVYRLEPGMCVVADAERAIGLGGVMGGADTEVTDRTVNVLIEAAQFNSMAIRNTARKLNLHSAASYRFERPIDAHNIDWASRRCCELILQLAGGELAQNWLDVGSRPDEHPPIELRFDQIQRILGIDIDNEVATQILERLGFKNLQQSHSKISVSRPSWRNDVTREIDLIEEIGRVHGYAHVPDDIAVPMSASHRRTEDRILGKVRNALTAAGFDEAMTASLIPAGWSEAFSPWSNLQPLQTSQGMLGVLEKASHNVGVVKYLRRSLVPSLLEARRINEYKSNSEIELFEIAKVYLESEKELPWEPIKIGLVSQRDFFEVKGVIETLLRHLNWNGELDIMQCDFNLLDINQSCELRINGEILGWLGRVSESGKRTFGIRQHTIVAELDFGLLCNLATLIPLHTDVSLFPAISRDFNFIVQNRIHWSDLRAVVAEAAGSELESIEYKETFRDPQRDGSDKKRLLMSLVLRSKAGTLTGEQADQICREIVVSCQEKLAAELVA
ncbi:MAG TPA: phenylalanine--tRNA ligase subunit beta [Pirellulaceae bacterium]|nr:phenylalanine--tRNA ligase subunit beta [Pirellulaceae bacterium]HMO93294.1 phenylalanine--tRNA ligase subunit beta [Pirellulaceae bacterium]HMP70166.1 phenylalanine--tRNA ligase subunit beta [Pirellulaceae bacterium]